MKREMKRLGILVCAMAALGWGAAGQSAAQESGAELKTRFLVKSVGESFNPQEKISLNLKDAKIEDVVRTLGALANLPVYVDPDVSGSVTIQVQDTPYETVLAMVGRESGVSVRIEGGKLVASRSSSSLLPAVTLPERFQGSPRLAVESYSKGFAKQPPIVLRVRGAEGESCSQLLFAQGIPPTVVVPPSSEGGASVSVTQFGYEPVTGARFLAVETPWTRKALVLERSRAIVSTFQNESSRWDLTFAPRRSAEESCGEPEHSVPSEVSFVTVNLEVRERISDATSRVVMAPRLGFKSGTVVTARSGSRDEVSGQHREFVIHGYLSKDGKSLALALVCTAIWVDPTDGREYVYAQVGELAPEFVTLGSEPVKAGTVPPGVATDRALDLTVWLAEKKAGTD